MSISKAWLQCGHTNDLVEAEVHAEIGERQLQDWATAWRPAHVAAIERLRRTTPGNISHVLAEHPADWKSKAGSIEGWLAKSSFSLMCQGMTQGMMIVDSASRRARLPDQHNKESIYIDYIEAAPWNRQIPGNPQRRFQGVGRALMGQAILLSKNEGFEGRIGLHSVPGAERFYESCGMTRLGNDPKTLNLCYFEMTAQQADQFISE